MMNKMAISKLLSVDFGKKMSVGGGLGPLQFFRSLKKGTRTVNFRWSEPSATFYHHWVDTITPEKKKQKKNAPLICLQKNTKFHIFVDRSLKLR